MAICWTAHTKQLDRELVLAPERYSAKRSIHMSEFLDSVPLTSIARLNRATINPAASDSCENKFIVLDTTHAVSGKVLFDGAPVRGKEVGSVKRPLQHGNVIVSRLRTYLRQIAYVDSDFLHRFEVEAVCSTEFYVLESIDPAQDIAFLVPFLLSEAVQDIFRNAQEGGHHPRIHHSVLMDLLVPAKLIALRDELSKSVCEFIEAFRRGEQIFVECLRTVEGIR